MFTAKHGAMAPGGLDLLGCHQACLLEDEISESSRKVLQSHRAAFSGDVVFSDAPRRRRASLAAAGDGAGTTPALFEAIVDYTKLGCNLFCSSNICRSKPNLGKPAVPRGLVSKQLNAEGLISSLCLCQNLLPPLCNSSPPFSHREISCLLSGVVNRLVTIYLLEDNFLSLYFVCLRKVFSFSSRSFG